eukprot:243282_1
MSTLTKCKMCLLENKPRNSTLKCERCAKKQCIVQLMMDLHKNGEPINRFCHEIMDAIEDEQDEKQEEKLDYRNIYRMENQNKVSLLYDDTAPCVCSVGHAISVKKYKHLCNDGCISCGAMSNHKYKPNKQQILTFLNQYNINQISFGYNEVNEQHKRGMKLWQVRGWHSKWPLHFAAGCGDIVKVQKLCKINGINVEQKLREWDDALPITVAARGCQLGVLIELIKNGANPTPPPDKSNSTPYSTAVHNNYKSIIMFYKRFIKYVYNVDINNETHLQCHYCYNFDFCYNKKIMDGTMKAYVYCKQCAVSNIKEIKWKQQTNKIIAKRITKTLKEEAAISVDTLTQMKDIRSLTSILREIIASGQRQAYSLWLFDIDHFRQINSYLTHFVADQKLLILSKILKHLELKTMMQWNDVGIDGVWKVHAFRQGGDEFALVVHGNVKKINTLQKFYEMLKSNINKIKLENMKNMSHMTVSMGVCTGQSIDNYEAMLKYADEAAEIVKKNGRNGIRIYSAHHKRYYANFNDWGQ